MMFTGLAQSNVLPQKAFDIADGFAITLILMLFMVLGAVALVARHFRRREKWAAQEEAKALNALLGNEPPEKPKPKPRAKSPDQGSKDLSWERDPDWWRRENP